MSGHTKGPWKVVTKLHSDYDAAIYHDAAGGRKIADMYSNTKIDEAPIILANAKLIASAPQLLACLESVIEAFPAQQLEDALGFDASVAIREALAKAKGTP